MLDRINKREKTALLVASPTEGMAELFYGLGEALTGEGGVSLGVIYLQLALDAKPDHAFALAALANTQESAKRYEDAIATYDKIPQGTPLQSAIDIRKAFNLNSLDRTDEAKAILERLADKNPKDVRPLEALGNILRARKDYADAVKYFTRAIAVLGKKDPRYWGYYYARGTSYERLKNWPAAEADLKKALALAPDQPLVLNYLGYSWIDQGKNLKEGMRLIEKAVQLKPDDGYIVDSLGWAHYRQGNYKEAVRFLERAVEIKPEDPTLNDHLGDAFWKVGREREARFQWSQALSLNPEPEDVDKIKAKLERGLDNKAEAKNAEKTRQVQRVDTMRRRSENKSGSPGRAVE
jgi:Flp pilus assembly protein TadD